MQLIYSYICGNICPEVKKMKFVGVREFKQNAVPGNQTGTARGPLPHAGNNHKNDRGLSRFYDRSIPQGHHNEWPLGKIKEAMNENTSCAACKT